MEEEEQGGGIEVCYGCIEYVNIRIMGNSYTLHDLVFQEVGRKRESFFRPPIIKHTE